MRGWSAVTALPLYEPRGCTSGSQYVSHPGPPAFDSAALGPMVMLETWRA